MSKYGARKNKIDYVVSEEVAIDQVNELLEYYDIDPSGLSGGDEEVSDAFEKALDHVCRAFRTGALSIEQDKDGFPRVIQTLSDGSTSLNYGEVSAKAKIVMEKFSSTAGYSRIYAFMGSLTGVGKAGIEKLGPRDLAVVEVLGTVFSNA